MLTLTDMKKRPFLTSLCLFIVVLIPRLFAINRYITPDELIWVHRSVQFYEAMQKHDWANTLTAGHPGVIVTWLGATGIFLQRIVQPESKEIFDWISNLAWLTPENMTAMTQLASFLTAGRLVTIFFHALGIILIWQLLSQLFPLKFGVLAILFILFDPFFVGLSSLLHVDALMTLLATISLLSLAIVLQKGEAAKPKLAYTAVSGAAASMAILTKSPAILLVPLCLFFLLTKAFFDPEVKTRRWIGVQWLVWVGCFAIVTIALFPALWSSFSTVLELTRSNANRHIEDALRPTFFWGRAALDHPVTFYPISIAFRLSPIVFSGLLLSFGLMIRMFYTLIQQSDRRILWQQVGRIITHPFTLFLVWSLLYIAGISLAAKKFDRYALPIFPMLMILSTAGWIEVDNRLAQKRLFVPILALLAVANLLFFQPYFLSAYNFLLGGPWVAQHVMPIGWGDSVSAGVKWVESNGDTDGKKISGAISQATAPFFSGEALLASQDQLLQADYIVWTVQDVQLNNGQYIPPGNELQLLKTIRYGGIDQAWVYAQPEPVKSSFEAAPFAEPINFGSDVALEAAAVRNHPEGMQALLQWRLLAEGADGRYQVRFTITDSRGITWLETEMPLVNETTFYPEHWPQSTATVGYNLSLPSSIAPAEYDIQVALIDEGQGTILPLYISEQLQGTQVSLGSIEFDRVVFNSFNTPIENRLVDVWAFEGVRLIGYGLVPDSVVSGQPFDVTLYWQAEKALRQAYQVEFRLNDERAIFPLSRFETTNWQTGQFIQEKYQLKVPTSIAVETADLSIRLLDELGEPIPQATYLLGQIGITALDRVFSLPENISMPLEYDFEGKIWLRGFDISETAVSAGERVEITFYWEVVTVPSELVSAFVHLVQPDGQNLAQSDQWPGGLPTALWADGQIIIDKHQIDIPQAARAGDYQLGIGLYTPENGVRLLVQQNEATPIVDNRIILPIRLQVLP